MELLIVKTGSKYIRVKPEGCLCVGLDKASVFPMDQLEKVWALKADLKAQNFENVCIKKLVLTEVDFHGASEEIKGGAR